MQNVDDIRACHEQLLSCSAAGNSVFSGSLPPLNAAAMPLKAFCTLNAAMVLEISIILL